MGIIVSYLFIFIIIISAKVVERFGKEASRKYIHIILGNWWFIAMYFFDSIIWASIVPISFVIINYVSYKKGLIAVMEREQQDGLGTVYYAVALLILVVVSFGIFHNPVIGLVGTLIMAYGDGFAAVVGKTIKSKEYHIGKDKKTIAGSITMFLISYFIFAIFLSQTPIWYGKALIGALIATLVEAVSIKGTDNITVPLLSAIAFAIMV